MYIYVSDTTNFLHDIMRNIIYDWLFSKLVLNFVSLQNEWTRMTKLSISLSWS